MNLIGLAGLAGCGKDTVAHILCGHRSYCRIAMADELKRILIRLYGFSAEAMWGASDQRQQPSPWFSHLTARFAAQTLGTEVARMLEPDTWAFRCLLDAKLLLSEGLDYTADRGLFENPNAIRYQGVCIPDVRFANEVAAVRALGGQVWLIQRPGAGLVGPAANHESEQLARKAPLEFWDRCIVNDGSLEDLEARVLEMA